MPRSLSVVLNRDDLADLEAARPSALDGGVLAFGVEAHVHLLERGATHHTPWNHIDPREWDVLRELERLTWRHWQEHARIDFEGFDLLQLPAFRHAAALTRLAWSAFALGRVLDAVRPSRVYAFPESQIHALDHPTRSLPLVWGMLRGLAEQRGIAVEITPRSTGRAAAGDQWKPQSAADAPPIDTASVLHERPFVLFHANGTDVARQLPLVRALVGTTDWRVVQLCGSADDVVLREARDCGHLLWHESQVLPPGATRGVAIAARDAQRRFDAAGRQIPPELRAIYANPHLRSHFDFIFGEYAARMAWRVRTWQRFLEQQRPAVVVTNYHNPLLDVAAALGIPCLMLPHFLLNTGLPRWYATLPASVQIAVPSPLHRELLRRTGIDAARIHSVGDPYVSGLEQEIRTSDLAAARRELGHRYGIEPHRRIVLLCTASPSMRGDSLRLPEVDWAAAARDGLRLAEMAHRRPEWAFVVRPHPRADCTALFESTDAAQITIAREEAFARLVRAADVVCMWNASTSALIEASLPAGPRDESAERERAVVDATTSHPLPYGRGSDQASLQPQPEADGTPTLPHPVLVYAGAMVWHDPAAYGTEAWPYFFDIASLERELERLFTDRRHYDVRARQAQAAVRRFLGPAPGEAAVRCMELLRELMESRAIPRPARCHKSRGLQPARLDGAD